MSGKERRRRRAAVIKRDRGRCRHCGSQRDLTLDHITPRAAGGSNAIQNLQLLCENCNRAKADAANWRIA